MQQIQPHCKVFDFDYDSYCNTACFKSSKWDSVYRQDIKINGRMVAMHHQEKHTKLACHMLT